ncbi:MAG: hypothetical protein HZB57_00605 [Gammaproteobacteria bacterium]|nr:hypothetical protein [Gammaproteobacteria bacterium]
MALLLLTLFPFHYHLHHDRNAPADGSPARDHVVDIHVVVAPADVDHHGNGYALDPASDITLKNSNVQLPSLVAILLAVLVLLPLGTQALRPAWFVWNLQLPRLDRHRIPPLRAPPRG